MRVKISVSLENKLIGHVVYDNEHPPFDLDRIMDGWVSGKKPILPSYAKVAE